MRNWYKYFGNTIINRGKNYYKSNRVHFVTKENDNEYIFSVNGDTGTYRVKIIKKDNGYDFKCNCKYYKDGNNCKHIVASLFKLDDILGPDDGKVFINMEENPFIKKDGKYRYYDMGRMTRNIKFTNNDYKKAKNIVSNKEYDNFYVSLENDRDYDEGTHYVHCEIISKDTIYDAHIRFSREKITTLNCSGHDCPRGNSYDYDFDFDHNHNAISKKDDYIYRMEICYHQLAVLLLLDDYFEKNNNKFDSTSKQGNIILNLIKENATYYSNLPIINKNQELEIDIQFLYKEYTLYVNFRIGNDKKYVISNIREFLYKIQKNECMAFGNKTNMFLSEDSLTEKSKKIYLILKRHYEKMEYMLDDSDYMEYRNYYVNKDVPFVGELADEIFEYLFSVKESFKLDNKISKTKHQSVAIIRDFNVNTIVEEATNVSKDESCVYVKINVPILFHGLTNIYFFDKEYNLCSCKKEKIDKFLMLFGHKELKMLASSDVQCYTEFIIGQNKISDFYNDVLPVLNLYGKVNDRTGEIIKSKIAKKTTYLFKIDYQGNLICRLYKVDDENIISIEPSEDLNFEEKDIILCVEKYFPIYDSEKKYFISETNIDEMYYILGVVLPYYMKIGEVEISENIKKLQKPKKAVVTIGVSVKSNLVDLKVDSSDLSKEEIEDILLAYKRKVKYYKAKNNDIIDIQNSNLEILNKMEDVTGLKSSELFSKQVSLPLYRSIYLDELLKEKNDIEVSRDEKFNELINKFESAKKTTYELPKSVNVSLRNYQIDGYHWIKTLDAIGFCGILADEMGLGKTLQVILYLASLYENGEKGISIIIVPASLVYNWKFEFEKFAPEIKVITVAGLQDERIEIINNLKDCNVIITSYDLFKRDIDLYKDINFRCTVIDEAQYIKNQTTKVSKSTKIINSKFRLALTGTPIENRLSELWSIFDFLMPNYLYSYNKFRKNYELSIIRDGNEEKLATMRKMVQPFILRRKKEEVLKDLPEKIDNDYYVYMNEKQMKIYTAEAMKLKKMILTSDYDNDKIVILSQITRLRQICCDPSLIYDNYIDSSSKKDACISLVESAIEGNHKILIFSQFTSMLDILMKEFTEIGIKYYVITGKTTKNERVMLVDKFNNDDVPVFFISLKAGGTGLNLIGADTVIHYDPWWNTSVQNQATDRAHRIGQKKVVNVYKLITKNTIEEKIIEMQKKKEKISNDILSGDFGGLSQLSKDELIDLIGIES